MPSRRELATNPVIDDKIIRFYGLPDGIRLSLDYDDVDHKEVRIFANKLARAIDCMMQAE